MAQPHKGDRQTVTSKIPRKDSDKLDAVVALTSEAKSDIVARLLHEWLETIDLERLRAVYGQEELLMRTAS
ncbi:hypothetical protein SPF06_19690 [Sinomonas sp. JGH33]|uniref:CopG family transcriptional regulator n=1 Tax=Sinomonas terricola TaxID=3110330 RepID=A0ABU5TD00_9MICC|nr:hypothetical protein [Sinomonas sp. JGH33]MEA5456951.1 hypothetical protein [Sinomonas sp. JGH33]